MSKVNHVINIAIFASGNGSNAEVIIKHFKNVNDIKVKSVLTNNAQAYVVERAKKYDIPYYIFNREEFNNSKKIIGLLQSNKIDFIVLAGFLWLIPNEIISHYPSKIVNIHPALLPAYGGKGMYGNKVHEAVVRAREKETGITIHLVNEHYDKGDILFQAKCAVDERDTPYLIQKKVHGLEHKYFPSIIEKTIRETFKI